MYQSSTKLTAFINRQAGYKQCLVKFCSQQKTAQTKRSCCLSTLSHEIKRHSFVRKQKEFIFGCWNFRASLITISVTPRNNQTSERREEKTNEEEQRWRTNASEFSLSRCYWIFQEQEYLKRSEASPGPDAEREHTWNSDTQRYLGRNGTCCFVLIYIYLHESSTNNQHHAPTYGPNVQCPSEQRLRRSYSDLQCPSTQDRETTASLILSDPLYMPIHSHSWSHILTPH